MNFAAFLIAIGLLAQAAQSTPIQDPIDDANAEVKKNNELISKLESNLTVMADKINVQFRNTSRLGSDAYDQVKELLGKYQLKIDEIDDNYHEKYGNFTESDKICIDTKHHAFWTSKHRARRNISNIIGDESEIYSTTLGKIEGNLDNQLIQASINNQLVLQQCSYPFTNKVEECLSEKLADIKQMLEKVTKGAEAVSDDIEKHSNINEIIAKELQEILLVLEDQFKKEVDDYSNCLISKVSTSTAKPSTTVKA